MIVTDDLRLYLAPADYIDSDHPAVIEAAAKLAAGHSDPTARAIAYYYAVRDGIVYGRIPVARGGSMAEFFRDVENYRASNVLAAGYGYCVSKASVFAALCRGGGIPARVGFADVTNHFGGGRLRQAMETDLFAWHGYAEVYLDERWLRVTPVFNAELCERLGVAALDFDGTSDALLQPFDRQGRAFLTYVTHHGTFHDVPARFLAAEIPRLYPGLATLSPQGEIIDRAGRD